MKKYGDTLNFRLWAKDTSTNIPLDLVDNDYFNILIYTVDDKNGFNKDPAIQVTYCSKEQEEYTFLRGKDKSACVGGLDKINLKANWQVENYNILAILVAECKNSTENKNRCKPKEEI